MKLDDYVEQTLVDIANGVSRARQKAPVGIAPATVNGKQVSTAQMVSFEIIVVVNKEAEGGLKVFSVADFGGAVSSAHTNRLSFQIPVYFQDKI